MYIFKLPILFTKVGHLHASLHVHMLVYAKDYDLTPGYCTGYINVTKRQQNSFRTQRNFLLGPCFMTTATSLNNAQFQKIPIPTPGKVIGNSEGKRVSKAEIFKGKYEAKREIPGGWGVQTIKPSMRGYGYFLEPHNVAFRNNVSSFHTMLLLKFYPGRVSLMLDIIL